MSIFDDREKAFEARYSRDKELEFKILVRRDKLFGAWAAEQAGLSGEAVKEFARAVVESEIASHEVIHKVEADLAALGHSLPESNLLAKLHELHEVAREQVITEHDAAPIG